MVNPDVNGSSKTLNHKKILIKRKKQQLTELEKSTETEI